MIITKAEAAKLTMANFKDDFCHSLRFRSGFSFMLGTTFEVYVAQNYNVPTVNKLYKTVLMMAKHYEENYRKLKGRGDDDDRSDQ
ncbi:hypothetical protein L1887_07500 [Cichorium endivia]|nr:hypothetical protein L1887_07500 [Cichorium endivia]